MPAEAVGDRAAAVPVAAGVAAGVVAEAAEPGATTGATHRAATRRLVPPAIRARMVVAM